MAQAGWTIDDCTTASGDSPVRAFLAGLQGRDRVEAFALLQLLAERGDTLRLPHSRPLGGGLFELRGMQVRIFYVFKPHKRLVLLDASHLALGALIGGADAGAQLGALLLNVCRLLDVSIADRGALGDRGPRLLLLGRPLPRLEAPEAARAAVRPQQQARRERAGLDTLQQPSQRPLRLKG